MSEYDYLHKFGYSDEELDRVKQTVLNGIEQGLRLDQMDFGTNFYLNECAAALYLNLKNPGMTWHLGALPEKPIPPGTPEVDTASLSSNIPSTVTLQPYCSPVENQLRYNSCVGNGTVGAMELLANKKGLPFVDRSRLFVYYNARAMGGVGNKDAGAYVSDGVKSLSIYGVCPENIWPYEDRCVFNQPTPDTYQAGSLFKATQYMSVAGKNVDAARKIIASGYPIIFAMDCFSAFMSTHTMRTGILPMPNPNEKSSGGHCILAVMYDDNRQAFLIRNSWGPLFGLAGYFWMSYEYYSMYTWDAWTVIL
jgi:C1A family cysteine protease